MAFCCSGEPDGTLKTAEGAGRLRTAGGAVVAAWAVPAGRPLTMATAPATMPADTAVTRRIRLSSARGNDPMTDCSVSITQIAGLAKENTGTGVLRRTALWMRAPGRSTFEGDAPFRGRRGVGTAHRT